MAIYTQRGLKIRLPLNFSFALMSRLFPEIMPFRYLKMVEALELLPATWTLVIAMIMFIFFTSPIQIGVAIAVTGVIMHILRLHGFPLPRFFTSIAYIYSYVSGFGIFPIGMCLFGYIYLGWMGVAAYLIAKASAGVINLGITSIYESRVRRETGLFVTISEIVFLNAYKQFAKKLKIKMDVNISDDELKEKNWHPTFEYLKNGWPEVVARFTADPTF